MKKRVIKKNIVKKPILKQIDESQFWQQIALKQQMLIHAKNNT
ncbi:MAG: hypothetical protein WC822_00205 [Candidatus Paceibacterota bacterium]|jgi:hypothetical protein